MSIQANSLTLALPGMGLIVGTVTGAAVTPAFTGIGSTIAATHISVTDTGTGDYSIVVKNFKGPKGVAYGFGSALTAGSIVNPKAYSYSGNTLTMQFLVTDAAAAALDDTFNVYIVAA